MRVKKAVLLDIIILVIWTMSFSGNLLAQRGTPGDSTLKAMNRTQTTLFMTLKGGSDTGKPYHVLVIGNSLTWHSVAENIGWMVAAGMAASVADKDYVHLLHKKMISLLPDRSVVFRVANLASFERNYNTFDFKRLDSLHNFKPDLIVFQLGENVSISESADLGNFEEKYVTLINSFKAEKPPFVLCTTPFFPSQIKNESIKKVAERTGSFLVDLSNLTLLNKENYARDEVHYPGNRSVWKHEGIGNHPGDLGMRSIAEQLFIPIKALIRLEK